MNINEEFSLNMEVEKFWVHEIVLFLLFGDAHPQEKRRLKSLSIFPPKVDVSREKALFYLFVLTLFFFFEENKSNFNSIYSMK
jgi:hypothetical protein